MSTWIHARRVLGRPRAAAHQVRIFSANVAHTEIARAIVYGTRERTERTAPPSPTGTGGADLSHLTIDLFATTAVLDHSMRIERHDPPHNPNLFCPILTLCGFSEICSSGGEAILNPTGPACAVPVQATHWGMVKALYE